MECNRKFDLNRLVTRKLIIARCFFLSFFFFFFLLRPRRCILSQSYPSFRKFYFCFLFFRNFLSLRSRMRSKDTNVKTLSSRWIFEIMIESIVNGARVMVVLIERKRRWRNRTKVGQAYFKRRSRICSQLESACSPIWKELAYSHNKLHSTEPFDGRYAGSLRERVTTRVYTNKDCLIRRTDLDKNLIDPRISYD